MTIAATVTSLSSLSTATPSASHKPSSATSGQISDVAPTSSQAITVGAEQSADSLSAGSVAAISVVGIIAVLIPLGGAIYFKLRNSAYGRLLDDQDYGSWGNYNNPLYDDS
ncbi:hypothetical protein scyTo_0017038 [Scyliorhinus torazame]|uniref:Prostate androgen-regulated mucin-like protein 1 n=1 Tax=Scyliorhinus torazame TaxID=75743 RepID=A0A401Q3G0_SCYTO|nr:hypothetical protein [Scyliorhinus torazame]